MLKYISVEQLKYKMDSTEKVQLVDVREAVEYHIENVAGFILAPLSQFSDSMKKIDGTQHAYIMCKSGSRAAEFGEKLKKAGYDNFSIVEGGITAWINSGYDSIKSTSKVWSLERQVRVSAGFLICLGAILSIVLHTHLIFISVFVGVGLMFSGITDTCGMALMLAKMPWNKVCISKHSLEKSS
jgi:rhodanese-related sulfurtransferase